MAIEAARVEVSTVPVSLASGGEKNGVRVSVFNDSGTSIYLGGSSASGTVSASTGHVVAGSASLGMYVDPSEVLYAVTSAGTATVHVLRGGVES